MTFTKRSLSKFQNRYDLCTYLFTTPGFIFIFAIGRTRISSSMFQTTVRRPKRAFKFLAQAWRNLVEAGLLRIVVSGRPLPLTINFPRPAYTLYDILSNPMQTLPRCLSESPGTAFQALELTIVLDVSQVDSTARLPPSTAAPSHSSMSRWSEFRGYSLNCSLLTAAVFCYFLHTASSLSVSGRFERQASHTGNVGLTYSIADSKKSRKCPD